MLPIPFVTPGELPWVSEQRQAATPGRRLIRRTPPNERALTTRTPTRRARLSAQAVAWRGHSVGIARGRTNRRPLHERMPVRGRRQHCRTRAVAESGSRPRPLADDAERGGGGCRRHRAVGSPPAQPDSLARRARFAGRGGARADPRAWSGCLPGANRLGSGRQARTETAPRRVAPPSPLLTALPPLLAPLHPDGPTRRPARPLEPCGTKPAARNLAQSATGPATRHRR